MQFCHSHWLQLVTAIDNRGLTHLIAKDPCQAFKHLPDDLDGETPIEDWDPLASATWLIYGNAIECGGLAMLQPNDDGSERCPLCHGIAHDATVGRWIDLAADGCREFALENDLVDGTPVTIQ